MGLGATRAAYASAAGHRHWRDVLPDKIVLGGGGVQAGAVVFEAVQEFLRELASPTIGCSTEIAPAELGGNSPLQGAAATALEVAR